VRLNKLVATGAALLLAAGCGGGGGKAGGPPAKKAEPDPATLKVWMMGAGSKEQTEFLDGVETEFKARHPTTDVVVEYVPWPQATSKFQKALAGGAGPDVTEVGNTDVQSWIEAGAFADITGRVRGWAEGKDLIESAVANDQADGKTYAVPWYGGVRAVWYRKDWFAELGIQPPRSWAELTAAAKTIQDTKKVPGIAAPNDFTNGILSFVWAAGGDVAVKQGDRWVGTLDRPQAQEGVGYYTGLVTTHKVAPAKYIGKNELQGPQADFALGKVGMYIDGSWAYPQMVEVSKKNSTKWAAFPIPGKNGGLAPVFSGGSDLAVWHATKAEAAAFDYVTVLNSKRNAQAFADTLKFLPQFGDLLRSPRYQNDPTMAAFARAAAGGTRFTPASKGWADFEGAKKVIPGAVKNIMQGKPIAAELQKANEQANDLLNP
jgi:ABC-type glycerol-3-phosphate transport system substrate-binding protein